MKTIKFEVPGRPQGKGRARFSRHGEFVRTRTPEKTLLYENWILLCFPDGEEPLAGPVRLCWTAYMPIAESWSKKKKAQVAAGEILPTVKPDADNVFKVLMDALNTFAWLDDKQVVDGSFSKRYSDKPRLEVEISEIDVT